MRKEKEGEEEEEEEEEEENESNQLLPSSSVISSNSISPSSNGLSVDDISGKSMRSSASDRIHRNLGDRSDNDSWRSFCLVMFLLIIAAPIVYLFGVKHEILAPMFIMFETDIILKYISSFFSSSSAKSSSTHSALPVCSRDHLLPLAEYLYTTTPYNFYLVNTLPTLQSLHIDLNTFRSTSTYNYRYPIQIYHNICMKDPGNRGYTMQLISGGEESNKENEGKWKVIETEIKNNAVEPARVVWRHWRHGWNYPSKALPNWYYLSGTTIIEDNLLRTGQNFGHAMEDHILPLLLLFLHTTEGKDDNITHNDKTINNILLHAGCIDEKYWNSNGSPSPSPGSTAGDIDDVWPAYYENSGAIRWLYRILLREAIQLKQSESSSSSPQKDHFSSSADYSLPSEFLSSSLPPSPLTMEVKDNLWGGAKLVFLQNVSSLPNTCDSLIDEPICFERLVILGKAEDRNNHMTTEQDNIQLIMVFRNITFKSLNVPPPYRIPLIPKPLKKSFLQNHLNQFPPTYLSTLSPILFNIKPDHISTTLPRVLIYGREDSDRRIWTNLGEFHSIISSTNSVISTIITSMNSLSLCEQMVLFSQHDIFIMPHGAGIIATVWAPVKSLVIEIFPISGVEETWLSPMIRALDLRLEVLYADERFHNSGIHRESGQDDHFSINPQKIVEVLQKHGVNISPK